MPRRAVIIAMLMSAVAGCGGATRTVSVTTTAPSVTTSEATTRPSDEVLAVPTVGGFYGRCPRGTGEWTLQFIAADTATDIIGSKVGNGRLRHHVVKPGGAATFHLAAGAVRTPEPADRVSRHPATAVATTPPLDIQISQGTEPQYLRVDVHLALATIGGETGQCVLVGSRVDARTYFNGAP